MATERLRITRNQLAEFLKDHQSIKQFERLFSQSNEDADALAVIDARLDDLENPPGVVINANYQASTGAYWIVASVTGLTVTLPKCASGILGRVWSITLAAVGDVTISAFAGDSFPTPDTPTETTAILNRRGSTVSFRCTSSNTWGFA